MAFKPKLPKWMDPEPLREDVPYAIGSIEEPWIVALEAIDKRDDKAPLIELLKSDYELPHEIRFHLADLIERYQLKSYPGGQRAPSYEPTTLVEEVLASACRDVSALVKAGTPVGLALDQVSDDWASRSIPVPRGTLAAAYAGKRGSTHRLKKLLKKGRS